MLSHGHISKVIYFISYLYKGETGSLSELQILTLSSQTDKLWLTKFCQTCKFIYYSHDGRIVLSDRGIEIAEEYIHGENHELAFRQILHDFICETHPPWAYKIPAGREEAFSAMNDDERFCFVVAGLAYSPVTDDVVRWWDEVAAHFRSADENKLLETGRKGERLTLKYEMLRTGTTPKWISIDSNYAGYDILSVDSNKSQLKRMIEVKTTSNELSSAVFYVTPHEWETAETSLDKYYFYLWSIEETIKLAILSANQIKKHIPENRGSGQWTSIAIPFSVFSESFTQIDSIR